jgi:hypothetical protein
MFLEEVSVCLALFVVWILFFWIGTYG